MADLSALERLRAEFAARLAAAATDRDLKALDDEFLSRKSGSVTALLKTLPTLPADERRGFGSQVNALKTEVEAALAERAAALAAARPPAGAVDVTLPARDRAVGRVHPLMQLRQQVEDIFVRMGYEVLEGPEVEDDIHNFEALNMPPDHPARDMQDTLYLSSPIVGGIWGAHQSGSRAVSPGGAGPRGHAAAHAHVGDADPLHEDVPAAGAHPGAGTRLPPRQPGPDAHADVPAVRGRWSSAKASRWRT